MCLKVRKEDERMDSKQKDDIKSDAQIYYNLSFILFF